MATPILPWDAAPTDNDPKLVWRSKLDGRYLIEVERLTPGSGTLRIFDHDKADAEIASWDVTLMYGAKFGPDVCDVAEWQEKCAEFVDNKYAPYAFRDLRGLFFR